MSWSPGTIERKMLESIVPSDDKPIELIVCGYCNKLNSLARTRRILSEKDSFIGYRCIDCAIEGKPLP